MNVKYMFSLMAVVLLFLLPYVGVEAAGMKVVFGVMIPYLAGIVFVVGFMYRIVNWAYSPVPFRIPTTCGQQKTLPWISHARFDNPDSFFGVVVRMFLEVVFFRSLFRNIKSELKDGKKLVYSWEIWLWLAALAFHWAFAVTVVRHLRFFAEPVPMFIKALEFLDGFMRVEIYTPIAQVGLPGVFLSGLVLLAATMYLLARRMYIPQVKYISLPADYFPLFLIIAIALSGIIMRYFTKVDIVAVKEFTMGLVTFRPAIPKNVSAIFYIHVFLVSALLAYFPFSKLMHLGGIFMSPTRNLTTDTRARRHVNPWNYPVKVHTYEEYEEEFKEKMIEAGLPVEKE